MADIAIVQARLNDMKIYVKKALDEAKPDKKLLLSFIEKQTNIMEDMLKMIEEIDDRFELLEGRFVEK
jgi:hypothetical protein